MKNLYIIIAFFIVNIGIGQKMPSDYFEEANRNLRENKLEEALKAFQYIVDNHPNNELFSRSYYNTGYIFLIDKKVKDAISVFKKIIQDDFNEKEIVGVDITSELYANFKQSAAYVMSEIYLEKEMYDSSLYYLNLSETFPNWYYDDNIFAWNKIQTSVMYSRIYRKLHRPNKAIEKLLPIVFISQANNSKLIEELKILLSNKKGIKRKLDKALDKIYAKKFEQDGITYTKRYIKFLKVEIEVSINYGVEFIKYDKERMIEKIKRSRFYNMVENL